VRTNATALESAGNILALYRDAAGDELALRVSLVAPVGITDGAPVFADADVRVVVLLDEGAGANLALPAPLAGDAPFAWDRAVVLEPGAGRAGRVGALARAGDCTAGDVVAHLTRCRRRRPPARQPRGGRCVITFTPTAASWTGWWRRRRRTARPTRRTWRSVHHGQPGPRLLRRVRGPLGRRVEQRLRRGAAHPRAEEHPRQLPPLGAAAELGGVEPPTATGGFQRLRTG
jgi:hypothetical protein